eukprot:2376278-Prymnesium_polylepis.1
MPCAREGRHVEQNDFSILRCSRDPSGCVIRIYPVHVRFSLYCPAMKYGLYIMRFVLEAAFCVPVRVVLRKSSRMSPHAPGPARPVRSDQCQSHSATDRTRTWHLRPGTW